MQAGFPWLRLRPRSADVLQSCAPPPALRPTADGCYVDLTLPQHGYQARPNPAPIGMVYLMDGPIAYENGDSVAISKVEALKFLLANTWTTRILDRTMRAHEFEVLSSLARTVPMRRVLRAQVPNLCDALLGDLPTTGACGGASATRGVMPQQF